MDKIVSWWKKLSLWTKVFLIITASLFAVFSALYINFCLMMKDGKVDFIKELKTSEKPSDITDAQVQNGEAETSVGDDAPVRDDTKDKELYAEKQKVHLEEHALGGFEKGSADTSDGIVTKLSGKAAAEFVSDTDEKYVYISPAVKLEGKMEKISMPQTVAILSADGNKLSAKGAFRKYSGLKEICFGDGLEYIGNRAFYGCADLEDAFIPYGTEHIGDEAFAYCTSLKEMSIFGETSIGERAFAGCGALEKVYLSNGVTRVGIGAFEHTPFYKSLTDEYCVVGDILVKYNGNAADVVIPQGVRVIADGVFAGRVSVKSVNIPKSVLYIGNSAFRSCARLESITFEGKTEHITVGENAFDGCDALQTAVDGLTVNARDVFISEASLRHIEVQPEEAETTTDPEHEAEIKNEHTPAVDESLSEVSGVVQDGENTVSAQTESDVSAEAE